ncbi:hypothetical protein AAFF_G00078590 [Aldrovandia affinis]|uniref:Uncharacterized protein n=1 Tax=Aldrovandia affinis TaxID=143900 RepID=A0AAD7WCV1_9TELE|nr:hypothetical protein AAFF_G00078590 [Aldrovandia affinis]
MSPTHPHSRKAPGLGEVREPNPSLHTVSKICVHASVPTGGRSEKRSLFPSPRHTVEVLTPSRSTRRGVSLLAQPWGRVANSWVDL